MIMAAFAVSEVDPAAPGGFEELPNHVLAPPEGTGLRWLHPSEDTKGHVKAMGGRYCAVWII